MAVTPRAPRRRRRSARDGSPVISTRAGRLPARPEQDQLARITAPPPPRSRPRPPWAPDPPSACSSTVAPTCSAIPPGADPLPQGIGQRRAAAAAAPRLGLGPTHVLDVDEELHGVHGVVERPQQRRRAPTHRGHQLGHGIRSRTLRRTWSVYPAKGAQTSPGPLSGRRSRTTRWAARSRVVHPSHRVGAAGPSSSKRSQRVARSCWASESGGTTAATTPR